MSYRRLLTLFSVLLILSLVLVACGGDDEDPTEVPAEVEEEAPPPEEEEAPPPEEEEEAPPPEEEAAEPAGEAGALPPEGSWLARAMDGEFAGRVKADGDGVRADMLSDGNILYVYGNGGKLLAYQISAKD